MKRDEVPYRAPGHREASAAATVALATLPYPIAVSEAARAVGDATIPIGDRRVPMRDVLAAMPVRAFDSVEDAIHAVDDHWGRIAAALGEE